MEKPNILIKEVLINDNNSIIDTRAAELADIRKRKSNLWKALVLSSSIDIALSFVELATIIETLGGSIIIDEIIEYFISKWVAGANIDLKNRSRIIGFIPIPGVTSISVQALKEIWKLSRKEKELQ